ncbi:hypothetical protein [Pengzhenrongella frigida]|uniref:Uncharacterized protein n=1 Tax=Pengzhenrongella frigida TaxID=1259133 RepID=A0A4V1ZH93_9MICO|nr:hypothetical protein [Cellulomonas sp. HLT2-17]RYV51244.1 hypothetical protein EUA98_09505 [Cellulomonas sp. HLT2-17]
MAKKLSTTRKGLAIGLAVVGIAGLSLASAAQLNLTGPTTGTLQAGVATIVNADCQTSPISVTFAAPVRTGKVYKSESIDITGIDAACSGKNYKLSVLNGSDVLVITPEQGGTVATVVAPAKSALSVNISGLTATSVDTIKSVALTIYS